MTDGPMPDPDMNLKFPSVPNTKTRKVYTQFLVYIVPQNTQAITFEKGLNLSIIKNYKN